MAELLQCILRKCENMKQNNIEHKMAEYCQKAATPSYIVSTELLEKNLQVLSGVMKRTGAKILLAQKAFSMFSVYPLIGKYLTGTTASGLYEARLGREEMENGEVHVYCPAYKETDIEELLEIADHIVFNSKAQWEKYKQRILTVHRKISCGLRINPEYAEIETDIYNPCITGSRLGITLEQLEKISDHLLEGIEGLHFHTMCEQGADVLERTIQIVDKKFGRYLKQMKWINLGGGHHITKEHYDIAVLEKCIHFFQEKYQLQVYLEPGEAIALNAGFLVAEVLDIVENGMCIAILDTSAACHMPDVIEMPYRPDIIGAVEEKEAAAQPEKYYRYRLGGPTCLAGDIIGDYSFEHPLHIGDKLLFCDMAIYSMVKNNTFNGMPLPHIYLHSVDRGLELVKQFGYDDFKKRLS